ncbi:MAG: 4Fe-4S dicluster domain-containing protein [Thermoplasmata archaeon]
MPKKVEYAGAGCSGCRVCASVCAWYNGGSQNWKHGRISIVKEEPDVDYPVICRQCKEPECLEACKFGALLYNDAGVLTVNHGKCTGCGACVRACPFGGIKLHPLLKKAIKCDLCNGLARCIEHCPEEVLCLKEVSE